MSRSVDECMSSQLAKVLTARAPSYAELGPAALQTCRSHQDNVMPLCRRVAWGPYRQASLLYTSRAPRVEHHAGAVIDEGAPLPPGHFNRQIGFSCALAQRREFSSSRSSFRSAQSPYAVYKAGIDSGELRKDPRQEHAMRLLETLFEDLKVVYPPKPKRSNLTMVDNVTAPGGTTPWYASSHVARTPGSLTKSCH